MGNSALGICRPNRLARKLKRGEDGLGVAMRLASETVVEVAGTVGCDAVVVDLEHEGLGIAATAAMIRTASLAGMTPLVRIGRHYEALVDPLLSAGAQGFCLARVKRRDDVDRLVDAIMYHPAGHRTFYGISRAAAFGHGIDEDNWAQRSNGEMFIEIVIEEAEALDHLDEILTHPHVSAVQFGPKDLRQSLGMPPMETVTALVAEVTQEVRARGLSLSRSLAAPLAPPATRAADPPAPKPPGDLFVANPTGILVDALSRMASSIRREPT
ncbi:aldolase/citrate lyase family protein [Xanthobacter sp. KR7-65]|uniref:HpcH/HpaI aldolase family protein n=1 Tax=Xanthobacter sp. KR7-65 TaxID=3156612 RepID=UPI0032B5BB79